MTRITPLLLSLLLIGFSESLRDAEPSLSPRERISINHDWRFTEGDPPGNTANLAYDVRPEVTDARDDRDADTRPTEAVDVGPGEQMFKPWILPTGNRFVSDPAKRHARPDGHPGADVTYVRRDFDDSGWEREGLFVNGEHVYIQSVKPAP